MRIYGLSDDGPEEIKLFDTDDAGTDTFDATRLTFTRYRVEGARAAICYEGVTLAITGPGFAPGSDW